MFRYEPNQLIYFKSRMANQLPGFTEVQDSIAVTNDVPEARKEETPPTCQLQAVPNYDTFQFPAIAAGNVEQILES